MKSNRMYRKGPTFLEYIEHKTGKSSGNWGVIQSDNILAESSLFAQVHKCNITVVWRSEGLWKLFQHTYSADPISITILYANVGSTLVNLAKPSEPVKFALRLCSSTSNRALPLYPNSPDWFESSIFLPDIPASQELTASLKSRRPKEHRFQAPVEVEGDLHPDSSGDESEITTSSWNNSFIDDDFSQRSGPPSLTPPEIARLQQNSLAIAPLSDMRSRRRIIISSSDDSQPLTASQGKQSGAPSSV